MARHATKVRRSFWLSLTWVAAIALSDLAPKLIHAQAATASAGSKASTPWKFRLEEARIEDIHRAIKSGQITCAKLVQAYINRIRAYDGMCVAPVTRRKIPSPTLISHATELPTPSPLSTLRATAARTISPAAVVLPRPSEWSITCTSELARRDSSRARRWTIADTSAFGASGRANARSASAALDAVSN